MSKIRYSFEPISSEITGNEKLATMLARQATDYARWALFAANQGWSILHDALLDALTRKAGWVRWYWGKRQQTPHGGMRGPAPAAVAAAARRAGHRGAAHRAPPDDQRRAGKAVAKTPDGQMYLEQGGPRNTGAATITRSVQQAWPVVESVPSECVWVVSDASTVKEARGVFHVRDVPASDLIEMGLHEHAVLRAAVPAPTTQWRREAIASDSASGHHMHGGPTQRPQHGHVRYIEGWIRCDADNDHKAELLHTHSLGNDCQLMQWERTRRDPLVVLYAVSRARTVIGSSQCPTW